MNYRTFINEVDRRLSVGDADSLRLFIHEMARKVSEIDRSKFLSGLDVFCCVHSKKFTTDKKESDKKADTGFEQHVDSLSNSLLEIQNGNRKLMCKCNEEWNDWYDCEDEQFDFSDPDDILNDITEAVGVLHQCVDLSKYEKGAELAGNLSKTKVYVLGEFYRDTMDLQDLISYNLVNIDLKKTIVESLYLTCMGTGEETRAEAMLTVMDCFDYYSVTLDEILQIGTDEINLDSLLPLWIKALALRPSQKTDRLLIEAQNMLTDGNATMEVAERYAKSHPVLYQNILLRGRENASSEEMLRIGFQGMQNIPVDHACRSEVALLTAECALTLKNRQVAEDCWLEAFRSTPSVVNFLRIRVYSLHWDKYADRIRNIYTSYYNGENRSLWESNILPVIMFFDERFDEMIQRFMSFEVGTGSCIFPMEDGVAFLLMLMNSQKTDLKEMSEMANYLIKACSFDGEAICKGTDLDRSLSQRSLFLDCFERWKSGVTLTESTCELWLKRIEQWLERKVLDVMENNLRNLYDTCAAFIAAYGDVLESRIKIGEKDRFMHQYKIKYSRRRAFHERLKSYGMQN